MPPTLAASAVVILRSGAAPFTIRGDADHLNVGLTARSRTVAIERRIKQLADACPPPTPA
jgi:hypothetical protein